MRSSKTFEAYYPVVTEAGLFDAERRMNAAIVAVARADRDPVVDAAGLIAPGPANFADFVHFTDRGSAQMARLLGGTIAHLAARDAVTPPKPVAGRN